MIESRWILSFNPLKTPYLWLLEKKQTNKNNSFSNTVKLTLINSDYCEEPTRQSLDGSYCYKDPRPLAPGKNQTTRNNNF